MKLKQVVALLMFPLAAAICSKPAPAETYADMILSDDYVVRDELAAGDDIRTAVHESLRNRRFDELETMAETFQSEKSRTPSGLWKSAYFYKGLRSFWTKMPKEGEQYFEEWIEVYPGSAAAHIGYAAMLLEQAWQIRGPGFAKTVEKKNWEPFFETADRARSHLIQYKSLAAGDPHWYTLMAEIATIEQWSDSDFSALLEEAFDKEPVYYSTYFEITNRNLPKWGGTADKVDRVAREAVERTRATDGTGLYARIYWFAYNGQYSDDLFEDSAVDWTEMSQGMDDILARYPSQYNINHFAHFACLAGDYSKARELMARIKYQPMIELWGGLFSYYSCKLWAELTG